MYKVFFNDRAVYLGEDFSNASEKNRGLIYRYQNGQELKQIIELFSVLEGISSLHLYHHDLPLLMDEFRACFTLIEAGGGLVFNRKGEFLVIKRNDKWDLPKGKLEKGEDFESAAHREVEEETGLKRLTLVQPLLSTYHTYETSRQKVLKRTFWFEMEYRGNREPVLQAQEGITDHRWVAPGAGEFIRDRTYGSIIDVLNIRGLL